MIISHSHRFIFFRTPKTGSTSVTKALEKYQEWPQINDRPTDDNYLYGRKHMPPAVLKQRIPQEMWETYFKFSFIRDPLSWVVSQFYYNRPRMEMNGMIRHPFVDRKKKFTEQDIELVYHDLHSHRGLPEMDTLYQSTYTDGVDFIGRTDHLQEDLNTILEALHLPYENLLKLNQTRHRPAHSYYREATRSLVERLWARDFEVYRKTQALMDSGYEPNFVIH